jgi:hypothetical protein
MNRWAIIIRRLCRLLQQSYRDVLKIDLKYVANIERARKPKRLPTVFTRNETNRIFANLEGTHWLIAGASLINLLTITASKLTRRRFIGARCRSFSPGPHLRDRWLPQAVGAGGVTTAL